MKIGKYDLFHTTSFLLPKGEAAQFSVPLKSPHEGDFSVTIRWYEDDPDQEVEKNKIGARWRVRNDVNGRTHVDVSFVNLKAPFGGALAEFAEVGKIDGLPFGFMTFFQTYRNDTASFTIQFMMEAPNE